MWRYLCGLGKVGVTKQVGQPAFAAVLTIKMPGHEDTSATCAEISKFEREAGPQYRHDERSDNEVRTRPDTPALSV